MTRTDKIRVYILRTNDETTFYADETERDLMTKAAVRNGKTAYRQQVDIEPTAQGIAVTLNRLFEGTA